MTCELAVDVGAYLVPELLGEVISLVQGEARHQDGDEDMLAAQFIHHIRYLEEGVVL